MLSQSDLVSTDQYNALENYLVSLAPGAKRYAVLLGEFDVGHLANSSAVYRAMPSVSSDQGPHRFNSDTLILPETIAWERLEPVLMSFIQSHAKSLVRLKGLIYPSGDSQPLLIQASAGNLYPAKRLPARRTDDGIGRLVLICDGPCTELLASLAKIMQRCVY